MEKVQCRINDTNFRKEYPIGGGKSVDLACFKEGRRLAVKVETGKSYAAYDRPHQERFF